MTRGFFIGQFQRKVLISFSIILFFGFYLVWGYPDILRFRLDLFVTVIFYSSFSHSSIVSRIHHRLFSSSCLYYICQTFQCDGFGNGTRHYFKYIRTTLFQNNIDCANSYSSRFGKKLKLWCEFPRYAISFFKLARDTIPFHFIQPSKQINHICHPRTRSLKLSLSPIRNANAGILNSDKFKQFRRRLSIFPVTFQNH